MNSKHARTATLLAFALLLTVAFHATAFADTYTLGPVKSTQSEAFAGGDNYGNYTINISDMMVFIRDYNCGGVVNPPSCYETHYIDSPTVVYSATPPLLWTDPTPIAGNDTCALTPGLGFSADRILCNNGHMLFEGAYDGNGQLRFGVWTGSNPDPIKDYLGFLSIDGGFMTSNGNAYFIDGRRDTLDVAINLSARPVPEPSSLLLLGTGGLGILGMLRRKIVCDRNVSGNL
jgi:hypothetical protein